MVAPLNFPDDIDALARLLFIAGQSRRQAKRLIREAGGVGSAEELDAVLAHIEHSPARPRIVALAEALRVAAAAAVESLATPPDTSGGRHDQWLVCEGSTSRRTYLVYLCPAGSESFVAELFDEGGAPPDFEAWPADDGQALSNILWLDGAEPPPRSRRKELFAEARRQLRLYDAQLDAENPS
jgi:hypothetical protein